MATLMQQKPTYYGHMDLQTLRQYYCNMQPIKRQGKMELHYGCGIGGKRKIDSTLFSWKKKDEMCDFMDGITRARNEQNGIVTRNEVDNSMALVLYQKPINVLETMSNPREYHCDDNYSVSSPFRMEMC